ncbi:hypothetical protein VitviT2T_020906 [Vitis vinifera]|uniref:Pectinesterase inhibitor domain-containing protein n=1 Tax=Vitis vinifera TaxID=29760 RepID=A0ABY9D5G6_VITVI|nr:pectinesterase inhibitor-like [Vitis vinifera]WKA02752.1 hypothetical protein VitviT2T_020906 [Vitis vinifera]|eukprot:XP_003633605.1 PREDICTED: pectinesterase inhibitor-like [Vitis vinifera]
MNTISGVFFILILAFWPHQILAQEDQDLGLIIPNQKSSLGEELIAQVCDHAIYKDLCISSLQSVPESKDADLFELTTIALKLAATNATEIKKYVQKLLNKSHSDRYTHQCLADCSENYEDALDRIEDSLKALESKGYNDVNTWVTAAMADAESCEEGFLDRPGHKSPLTGRSTIFNQLCSIALTITNFLSGSV